MISKRMLLRSVLLGWVVACSDRDAAHDESTVATATELTVLKGHAVFGHEVRTITPCGENEPLWAIDSTQQLWQLHAQLAPGVEPYREVFVVVRGNAADAPTDGFGADYRGSFIVEQVEYAAGEGFGCDLDLGEFQYRLAGNEPFWMMVITDSSARLSRPDAAERNWEDIRTEMSAAATGYRGNDAEHGVLAISITREPCRDSMSGAYYGYSASVTLAAEAFRGCAIRGQEH